jgi:hypothetical protein
VALAALASCMRHDVAKSLVSTFSGNTAMGAISVLIGVLVIAGVGAICFWIINKFPDGRPCNAIEALIVDLSISAETANPRIERVIALWKASLIWIIKS